MNILLFLIATLFCGDSNLQIKKWGQIGHYVTGEIAEYHLTPKAKERVQSILGNRSIPYATVWMDDIRSETRFNYTATWHWATIADGKTYEETEQDDGGDIIAA